MKATLCVVLLLGIAAVAQSAPTPDEQAVLQTERQWLKASQQKDSSSLQRIIADDFTGSGPNGNLITKSMLVVPPGETAPAAFEHTHFVDLTAKTFGNTAVVFGRMVGSGTESAHDLRFTMVYAKREGAWQMIAAQLVPVTTEAAAGGK